MRFLVVGLLLLGLGCEKPAPLPPPPHTSGARFLALGDSYTCGELVAPADRWPDQLARALRAGGIDTADPEIIAVTGWTTDELSAGIDRAAPKGPYELVGLLIGVNNQFRNRDAEEYRGQFAALLKRAIAFAGDRPQRVMVLSIPDWGVTPYGAQSNPAEVSRQIDQFNAINREESVRLGVRYVDITPISREASTQPALVAQDGLHPSGAQYTRWVQITLPVARSAMGPTTRE